MSEFIHPRIVSKPAVSGNDQVGLIEVRRVIASDPNSVYVENLALLRRVKQLEEQPLQRGLNRRQFLAGATGALLTAGAAGFYEAYSIGTETINIPPASTPDATQIAFLAEPTPTLMPFDIQRPETGGLPELPITPEVEGFSVRLKERDVLALTHTGESSLNPSPLNRIIGIEYTNAIFENENQLSWVGYDANHENSLTLSPTAHEEPSRTQPNQTEVVLTALPIGDPQLVIRNERTGIVEYDPLILNITPSGEYPTPPEGRKREKGSILTELPLSSYEPSVINTIQTGLIIANTFGADINTAIITTNPIIGDVIFNDQQYGIVLDHHEVTSNEYPNPGVIEAHLKINSRLYKNAFLSDRVVEFNNLFESINEQVETDRAIGATGGRNTVVHREYLDIFNQLDGNIPDLPTYFISSIDLFAHVLTTLQDRFNDFKRNWQNTDTTEGLVLSDDDRDRAKQLVNFVMDILTEQSDGTWGINSYVQNYEEIQNLITS